MALLFVSSIGTAAKERGRVSKKEDIFAMLGDWIGLEGIGFFAAIEVEVEAVQRSWIFTFRL